MTIEELIEKLKEMQPHWIVEPEVIVNYEGHSIVSLYPKRKKDHDDYNVDEFD